MGEKVQAKVIHQSGEGSKPTPKKIAVVDNFSTKSICIDFLYTPDDSHGNVVKRFIEEGLPDAKIECFNLSKTEGGAEYFKEIDNNLGKILANIKKGEKYDALNMSESCDIEFDVLSKGMKKEITPENFAKNKALVQKWLNESKKDESVVELTKIINKLSEIASSGTSVYIGAGNYGKNVFNMLSLSNNTKIVGALDETGAKADYSAKNSLVNKWDLGVLKITKLKDKNGKSGFDYTGDGTIDIYSDKTSCPIKIPTGIKVEGTSFSTPRALVRDLKKK